MRWISAAGVLVAAAAFAQPVRAPFHVSYDAEHLDLDKHVLQFKPSRPVATGTLTVILDDGSELAPTTAQFEASTSWQSISWTQPENTRVMQLVLRVAADDGFKTTLTLTPWSVAVDHEDVNFRTDSSDIDPDERAKLDASYEKIADIIKRSEKFLKMQLYIAGHTDTVGSPTHNFKLSQDRARSIAAWFRKRGVKIPISYEGFGETSLAVKTADNVDEVKNRRADYILSDGPPTLSTTFHPSWKRIP
jgi:outer membrane protein OmpA-like peptidoglycan-associated protein